MSGGNSNFGGDWSEQKLDVLRRFLPAYTTALKNAPFKLAYVDAFAGSGLREIPRGSKDGCDESLLLSGFTEGRKNRFRHGSPLIALETEPPFDAFVFIEREKASLDSLQKQIEERYGSTKNVRYLLGDANEQLQLIAGKTWDSRRAVAFLDPFALQVKWDTLAAIAGTKAIDMWLLFPAMAVNRMLPRSGQIPSSWAERLDQLFGEKGWRDSFYPVSEPNLFGEEHESKVDQIFEALSEYLTHRLGSVFAGTHTKPLILRNSGGGPLFLFCFACGNVKGAPIATRIANHIINTSGHG